MLSVHVREMRRSRTVSQLSAQAHMSCGKGDHPVSRPSSAAIIVFELVMGRGVRRMGKGAFAV